MKSKCALIAFFLHASSLMSTTAQWTGATNGVWTTSTNWNNNTVPIAAGDVANLTLPTAMNTTMTLSPIAFVIGLQTLNIDNATGYTINPGAGPGSFSFSGAPAALAALNVTTANGNSTNSITANIALANPLTITQNSALFLTISGIISGGAAQPITIAGTGTTVFTTADNSGYTGQITISSGTLSISNDNNLGAAATALTIGNGTLLSTANTTLVRPISLTGNAAIQAALGFTSNINGIVSGVGSLTISNAGTVVLGSANTYQGGTTVTAGVLSISSDGNLGNTTGALNIGNGTLQITMPITTARSGVITGTTGTITSGVPNTFNGNFGGPGALTLQGAGTFTFLGSNSYTGGTTVAIATQLVGTTNGIQGTVNLPAATSRLTFSQNFDGTYAGVITGIGSVTKLGTGAVTFTNTSSLTGPTAINEGTLAVNGSIASSAVTINPGATLSGTGTVGITSSLGGTINPGSGSTVGTLSINGTLTQNAASHTNINLAPIVADKIAVSGAATIAGSLTIDPTPGFYGFSADYTILTSTGLAGTFAAPAATTNPAFQPVVTYTATNALLHIIISEPFALFSFSNFNTAAVGNNIDALYAANQLSSDLFSIFNTFIGQSFDVINNALDQMHPAPYSAFTEMQAELSGQLLSLFHRLPYLPCSCSNPSRLWVEPFGNSLTIERHGLEIGFQANTGGLAFGYDGQILENFVIGFGGAWNKSHLEWHDSRGHGDVNGLYGGIYFDSQIDSFYLGGSFLAGIDFYDTSRHLQFLTTDRHADAEYQALDIMAQISTAYLFGSPQAFFYPYGNLDYLYLHTHKFSETGAQGLDLKVQEHTDATLRTEMGLGLQVQDRNAAETMCISPLVSIGWVNMAPIQRPLLKSTFTGTSIPFAVRGWDETWNLLNVRFGLSISYFCFSLGLNYNVEISPNSDTTLFNQHGDLRLDWKW